MNLKKILFFQFALLLCFTGWSQTNDPNEPVADLFKFCSEKKGFNLLGKFDVSWSNNGFPESEFSMIHNLGFNFVRLPLDYRTYTQSGNWDNFVEAEVVKIDKAIQYGIKYGVHICINLHRAPGYCVNSATLPVNQQLNLWADVDAQKAFVKHWAFFANRYKAIAPDKLSFNLVNEPSNVTEPVYVSVMKMAIEAIHNISPNRIVFVDGMDYGRTIITALKDEPNVAQAIHCYDPFGLTHYKAEWVNGSMDLPVPTWPMLWISDYLYGPWKPDFKSTLGIQGSFPAGTEIIVNVRQVSSESTLTLKAGTKIILNKKFVSSADPGSDFTKVIKTEWGYQNISNKDFSATLTESSTKITFENSAGDWMTLNSISIKQGNILTKYTLSDDSWGRKQSTYKIDETGNIKTLDGNDLLPFELYRNDVTIAQINHIPFMVQEFGVYNKTPHQVAIGFLTDLCKFFDDNKIGWSLWNFNGGFGIINSDRADCQYEAFQGYKLDREMLNALTKSGATFSETEELLHPSMLFPSPAKDILYLSSKEFDGKIGIVISDITGRIVKNFNVETSGSEIIRLDISGLKSNMYVLSASNNRKVFTKKIIISR